ncbi:MAG: VWA domain-containing protein [Chitinophagaceae bacterium]
MSYQFEYNFFFWLLAAIPVFIFFFYLLLRWKRKTEKRIGEPRLVRELIKDFSPKLFTTKFTMLTVAFAAGVVAMTNLRKPGDADSVMRKGIDVVIALDVSKSMYAVDLQPNRLERAKQMISKLMDAMPDDRIGLVLFAGRAYLQMPLTTDHGAAKLFVNSASPDAIANQGTVIADAMQMSANAFNTKERRFKSVILLSDGEDHDQNAMIKADEMAEQGVMINTVGIGSFEGSKIVDPATGENKKDASGNDVVTRLNETELRQIATKTNGIYVHLENTDDAVNALLKQLSQIDKKAYGDLALMNFTTYYYWFAGLMFVLLIVENLIPEIKKKKEEKPKEQTN